MDRKNTHMNTEHSNASATRNRRHAALTALALGFAATAFVGCGGGEEENGTTNPAPTTNGATAAVTPTPSSNGADSVDAATDDAPAEEGSRATVDGTLMMFITAMEQGEFTRVVELVDPTTDLHTELLGVIEAVNDAAALDDPNAVDISNMIRRTFSLPFAGADYEIVSEDDARARAVITRPGANNDQHTVDLNRVDGEWFILAGRDLIRSPGSPPTVPPSPMPSSPTPTR